MKALATLFEWPSTAFDYILLDKVSTSIFIIHISKSGNKLQNLAPILLELTALDQSFQFDEFRLSDWQNQDRKNWVLRVGRAQFAIVCDPLWEQKHLHYSRIFSWFLTPEFHTDSGKLIIIKNSFRNVGGFANKKLILYQKYICNKAKIESFSNILCCLAVT